MVFAGFRPRARGEAVLRCGSEVCCEWGAWRVCWPFGPPELEAVVVANLLPLVWAHVVFVRGQGPSLIVAVLVAPPVYRLRVPR